MAKQTSAKEKAIALFGEVEKMANSLKAAQARLAKLEAQEAELQAQIDSCADPAKGADLLKSRRALRAQNEDERELLAITERSQRNGLQREITDLLEWIGSLCNEQTTRYSALVDQVEAKRAELDKEEQHLRRQWESWQIDKEQTVDIGRALRLASTDGLTQFLADQMPRLGNLVSNVEQEA